MEVALDVGLRNTSHQESFSSEDDVESILSVQEKETDVVQDSDSEDYDDFSSNSTLELEYEVATSDSDDPTAGQYEVLLGTGADGVSSSGDDDMVTVAIAAVLCDSSLETWATDCEDSDTTAYNDSISSVNSSSARAADFWTCLQCNGRNDQPKVRYCDKCFQRCWQCKTRKKYNCFPLCNDCYKIRKNLFPPRPRGARKRKMERQAAESDSVQGTRKRSASNSCDEPPVKLIALQNCLSGLSQDSGLGSSQEIPGLNFDKIVMPNAHQQGVKRKRNSSTDSDCLNDDNKPSTSSKQARLDSKTNDKPLSEDENATIVRTNSVASLSVEKDLNLIDILPRNIAACPKFASFDDVAVVASCSKIIPHSEQPLKSQLNVAPSESSEFEKESIKTEKAVESTSDLGSDSPGMGPLPELKEFCMICNVNPKNAIFLHGKIAHLCCCYKCAMKTWRISKRCPICNCKVKNVVKVYNH